MDQISKIPSVAYFSMEIGLIDEIKGYAGGLGILAGDTLKTAADMGLNYVGVSILYKKGYFKQVLTESGEQIEAPDEWDFEKYLFNTGKKIKINLKNEEIVVEVWKYEIISGQNRVPVFFLNTDIPENTQENRFISYNLYTPYHNTRMKQELVIGIGGVKALIELGYPIFDNYHLNESHAAFVIIELENILGSRELAKQKIVFTTHTPEEHGHKKYSREELEAILPENYFRKIEVEFEDNLIHLTKFCLRNSKYRNGVSKRHGEISSKMFPQYEIDYITNGIHVSSWAGKATQEVFDEYVLDWKVFPEALVKVKEIPVDKILEMHQKNKKDLIEYIESRYGLKLDLYTMTIGFARRVDLYKRSGFIFSKMSILQKIADDFGGLQIILSGKAYFNYGPSEEKIARLFSMSKKDWGNLKILYLEDYGIQVSKMLVQGCDLWLNNPIKPKEASGTSGMKAALNGVPSLSTIDGWWVEGWRENLTGWAIGVPEIDQTDEEIELFDLYKKLERDILPIYYNDKLTWGKICANTISYNASYFNTHRMLTEYIEKGYKKTV